jgi:hypothetical protein
MARQGEWYSYATSSTDPCTSGRPPVLNLSDLRGALRLNHTAGGPSPRQVIYLWTLTLTLTLSGRKYSALNLNLTFVVSHGTVQCTCGPKNPRSSVSEVCEMHPAHPGLPNRGSEKIDMNVSNSLAAWRNLPIGWGWSARYPHTDSV